MPVITVQELIDASTDATTVERFANGTPAIVTPRYGAPFPNMPKLVFDFNTAFNTAQSFRTTAFDLSQTQRQNDFNSFLASSGYETPVDYAPGINITRTTQIVKYLGELYRPKVASLPFVTTTFPADTAKWIANGDNSLRQDLAKPDGSSKLGFTQDSTDAVNVGAFGKMQTLAVDVREFGASKLLIDNRSQIQKAIDYCATNRKTLQSVEDYDIKGPLYIPAFLNWVGHGTIRNTYVGATAQMQLCIYPGTFNPVYYASLTYKAGSAVQAGASGITLLSPSQATTFSVGDIVFLRSTALYNGASGILPLFGTLNRVSAINGTTGRVDFEYPIVETVTLPLLAKVNGTGIMDIINEREIYCTYKSSIKGVSFESVNGHVMERGGMLGCDFYFPRLKSLSGLYTNLMCNTRATVDEIICDLRAIEVAGNSNTVDISVGTIAYTKTARSAAQAIISLNENQLNCHIAVTELSADSYDYVAQQLIHFQSARSNTLIVKRLQAMAAAGSLVTFENPLKNGVGETQTETSNNTCMIGLALSGTALQRNAFYVNSGGLNRRNKVIATFNTTPTVTAVSLSGVSHVLDCVFSAGDVSLSTATGCSIDVETPGVITNYARTSGNSVRFNRRLIESKPTIDSVTPLINAVQNGGGGAVVYTPNLLLGTTQHNSFTSATSYTIANPTGGIAGDKVCIVITNSNNSTPITPVLGSAFSLAGAVLSAIPVGKRAVFHFEIMPDFAYILMGYANNV